MRTAKPLSTFSIVAYDRETGDLGVAVASKFVAVGAIVPWVKAGVGAIATQALANPLYGPRGLELLERGLGARRALEILTSEDPQREHRQVGIVDSRGEAAAYTGERCYPHAGHIVGDGFAVQGNILAGPEVLEAMATAFETSRGELVDRLLRALEAGDRAGGDRRGKQSAAVVVHRRGGGYLGLTDKYVDLRVDDHPEPVAELIRIFEIWDLALLNREDPRDVVRKEDAARPIQEALRALGYYRGELTGSWDEATEKAFVDWANINNFENKLRGDEYIWGRIYRFLLRQAGLTP
ncbi:MAG: DUF1028 domain-containing protein [Fervidicoccaceae archaeon]